MAQQQIARDERSIGDLFSELAEKRQRWSGRKSRLHKPN